MSENVIDRRVFYAGAHIFREGAAGSEMFIVESGKVEIWKGTEDHKKVLGYIGKNGVFGEMALIDSSTRMASALAVEETVCKVVDKTMFDKNMKTVDPFMQTVIQILTKNVRSLSVQIDYMP